MFDKIHQLTHVDPVFYVWEDNLIYCINIELGLFRLYISSCVILVVFVFQEIGTLHLGYQISGHRVVHKNIFIIL